MAKKVKITIPKERKIVKPAIAPAKVPRKKSGGKTEHKKVLVNVKQSQQIDEYYNPDLVLQKQRVLLRKRIATAERHGYEFDIDPETIENPAELKGKELYKLATNNEDIEIERKFQRRVAYAKRSGYWFGDEDPFENMTPQEKANLKGDELRQYALNYSIVKWNPDYMARVPDEADLIISNVAPQPAVDTTFLYENLEQFEQNGGGKGWSEYLADLKRFRVRQIQGMIEMQIMLEGEQEFARRMEANAETYSKLIDAIIYQSEGSRGAERDSVDFALVQFAALIKGRALSLEENSALTTAAAGINE